MGWTNHPLARRQPRCRRLCVLIAAVLTPAACESGESEYVVENRTTVPIVLFGIPVPACGTAKALFRDLRAQPSAEPGSVLVSHPLPASADAAVKATVVVADGGVLDYQTASAPSLPPCAGLPPSE